MSSISSSSVNSVPTFIPAWFSAISNYPSTGGGGGGGGPGISLPPGPAPCVLKVPPVTDDVEEKKYKYLLESSVGV